MSLESKTLSQIKVCLRTRSAVNCSKGIEYCKECGKQPTSLIALEEAQKLEEEKDEYKRIVAKFILDIAEANKIITENLEQRDFDDIDAGYPFKDVLLRLQEVLK